MALRVGLIGCGRWGRHILADLRALDCDVAVVARSTASVARARDGGAADIVPEIAALGRVDGLVVASPTSTHADVVAEALELRVPVYCEKPLTADPESARRLAAAAPDRLFVMDKWRYHPGIEELARIAVERELGDVVGIHSRRVSTGSPHLDVDTVWIHAPHDLSIALEILGHVPEPRHAVGEVDGAGVLRGVTALCGDDPWLALEVSELAPAHRRELRLVCEDGTAILDGGDAADVLVVRHDTLLGDPERRPLDPEMPLRRELRAFAEHLRGGPPPRSSAAEGVAIVEAVARVRELALAGAGARAGA
jgi:predicted dehydrogenase